MFSKRWVCSSAGRAAVSKAAGRGFESLRTRISILLSKLPRKVNSISNKGSHLPKSTERIPVQRANTKSIENMEVKKTHGATTSQPVDSKKVVEFVGEVKSELKKVEWTSKDELKSYTIIVLASTFLLGMGIYFIDLAIRGVLGGINFIVRAIFG